MEVKIEDLLPENFNTYSLELKSSILEYLKQLSSIEKKACDIAKKHLGSSFNIVKSNGYNDWLSQKK